MSPKWSAFLDVGRNLITVDLRLVLVGRQNHDEVGILRRVGHIRNLKSRIGRLACRARLAAQADGHVGNARVAQIVGMRVALRTVADHQNVHLLDDRQICIFVVVNLHVSSLFFSSCGLQILFRHEHQRSANVHGSP